jgi:hypothetical protein
VATFSHKPSPITPANTRRADPNSINLSDYKGDIRICPFCKPLDRLGGRACNQCMSRGYVAVCLNCDGTGLHTAKSVWDGKSDHTSTCNLCGGKGLFPASETDYLASGGKPEVDDDGVDDVDSVTTPLATSPMSAVVSPMKNLQVQRPKSEGDK